MEPLHKPKKIPKSKRPKNPQKNSRIVDRQALQAAAKPYCELCYLSGQTQIHHIIYKSQGGHDTPDNLISLCLDCHEDAHGRGKNRATTPKEVLYRAKEGLK